MPSSILPRLLPALSVVAYALAYEGEMLTYEAVRDKGISWSSNQTLHVVLVLLAAYLVWRTVLWYRSDQPFAYKWLLFLLPLLGLQLLDYGWNQAAWYFLRLWPQDMSDEESERQFYTTYSATVGCVPLMVVLLAHLSKERAGMTHRISLFELVLVVTQTCVTIGTLASTLAQVSPLLHVRWLGDALLSALRIAYLGKILRQNYVSKAQLFGLGAVEMLQPVEMVISLIQYPAFVDLSHNWLAEQHLFLSLCILLTQVLQTWIVPTCVLITLGSVAAAELQTLRPSYTGLLYGRYAGLASTEPPVARWDDSYHVYDGINLGLALVVLASSVRTRWTRDTAALQQKARQSLSQPLNTAVGDERVELAA